jgi:hypothetical protein
MSSEYTDCLWSAERAMSFRNGGKFRDSQHTRSTYYRERKPPIAEPDTLHKDLYDRPHPYWIASARPMYSTMILHRDTAHS